jgi:hypothetical protein
MALLRLGLLNIIGLVILVTLESIGFNIRFLVSISLLRVLCVQTILCVEASCWNCKRMTKRIMFVGARYKHTREVAM